MAGPVADDPAPVGASLKRINRRWKIEAGFKEIKQEIGSAKTQRRNAQAVVNHLNSCMKCTTSWDDFTNLKVHCTGERYGSSSTKGYSPEIELSAVRTGVRECCSNLLDNAIKYGPTDQIVKVTLKEQPTGVQLSVSDQGPGIPRNERERIWDSYYRLDREHRSAIAGTGIGLAVVRELLSRHGGKAWVEDGCDGGACFVAEFPKAPHHEGIAGQAPCAQSLRWTRPMVGTRQQRA